MPKTPQLGIRTLAISALLRSVAGHQCADGLHVRCMGVSAASINGAPSTFGQGFGAVGSPMCTPDGRKVYCLANHDYHRCSAGQEPCCADGSNPNHRGNNQPTANNVQCSVATPAPALTPAPTPGPPASLRPIVIELDDMDPSARSSMANVFEGSFQPCMKDAYKGQFHHDWARHKGSASYTYKVNVPRSGCYMIEEYHPGSMQACSRYLPNNARLDVNYCKGKSKRFTIDQATRPAQWNHVGALMFFKDIEGTLVMQNHVGEKCVAQSQGEQCFFVTDAFRLTWRGATCKSPVATTQIPVAPVVPAPVASSIASAWNGKEGTLMIEVQHAPSFDVLVELQSQKGTLETALAVHLGHQAVEIVSTVQRGRRLHIAATHMERFEVRYVAKVSTGNARSGSVLQTLQDALIQAGSALVLQSATVQWGWLTQPPATQHQESNSDGCRFVVYIAIIAGCLLSALIAVGVTVLCRRSRKQSQDISPTVDVVGKEVSDDLEKNEQTAVKDDEDAKHLAGDEKDKVKDMEIASVSTGTPGSEDDVNSEGNAVTPAASVERDSEVTVTAL